MKTQGDDDERDGSGGGGGGGVMGKVTFGGVEHDARGGVNGDDKTTTGGENKNITANTTRRRNRNCGKMQSHLDRPVGWTLSVSVGRPVRFNLGRPPPENGMYANYAAHRAAEGQTGPGVDVVVESGDALLFRGHAVFHAVDGFADVNEDEDDGGEGRGGGGGGGGYGGETSSVDTSSFAPPPSDWAKRLQSAAKGQTAGGWRPARLALLFRDEVDAH